MTSAITRTTVGGVPAFVAGGAPVARVALAFRVGMIDEELPVRGSCHLVDHLALSVVVGLGAVAFGGYLFVHHRRGASG